MTDSKYTRETVLEVHPWVPGKLLSIKTTRSPGYEFTAGQFARLGLPAAGLHGEPPTIWRAYSMVTPPSQREFLEFYSIVVPEGEFSPRLAALRPGDALYVDKTAFGFLTLDRFHAGGEPRAGAAGGISSNGAPSSDTPLSDTPSAAAAQRGDLWLLSTGTGLSAYLSMLQDPATWAAFDRIILAHGVRTVDELAYRDLIQQWSQTGLPEAAGLPRRAGLVYLPIPTREPYPGVPRARLTRLIEDGRLEELAGRKLDPEASKIMLCGNPEMLSEARQLLKARGFAVGRRGKPGNLALENYW